ncbi:MAG: primosomal protein N' [Clostridiales bacterium]|jgi:primosomal protein N' (replication factor Y)|nr:primosomal protein N' [Clostridiales bacterium]
MSETLAEVVVSHPSRQLDRAFHYIIPDELRPRLDAGMRVIIPFGSGGKRYEGVVTGFSEDCAVESDKLKSIIELCDEEPAITRDMLDLAFWMREKYYATLAECLRCVMPAGIQLKTDEVVTLVKNDYACLPARQKSVCAYLRDNGIENAVLKSELIHIFGAGVLSAVKPLRDKEFVEVTQISKRRDLTLKIRHARLNTENPGLDGALEEAASKNDPRSRVLNLLAGVGETGMPVTDVLANLRVSISPVKTLERMGLVTTRDEVIRRNTVYARSEESPRPRLTDDQQQALNFILNRVENFSSKPILLRGVTGSGKTEVYLRVIEYVIRQNKQAIVLVPEISLTPQTVDRFISRFGELVTVTHSRLSLGERYDQWVKARDGGVSVMIGPRSAVFAPFARLGVIIIDEEHEHTYKSEVTPKYSAREVAAKRAEQGAASVIMGSATPSVTSYFSARNGETDICVMRTRVNQKPPDVHIIDMRVELAMGNRSIFSEGLREALERNIADGRQSILFLNRRGHSTFISCRKCGNVLKCDNCSVNYTYHISYDTLICHYCGKKISKPDNCPACGSTFIKLFGLGTQKVEEETRKLFPGERIIRMDTDTTKGKHGHADLLNIFRTGGASILIGTQMIAKGLDFPNVTLVGVMAADLSLNNGDFRAGETTFQLLTQVAGRAGRADLNGRVFIQTYMPDHYSVRLAGTQDYEAFYEHEIALRRQLSYPPFTHVFSVMFVGEREKEIIDKLNKLLAVMRAFDRKSQFELLGPVPAQISKIKNRFRWKLIIKAVDEKNLKNFALYCMDRLREHTDIADVSVHLTMDPMIME